MGVECVVECGVFLEVDVVGLVVVGNEDGIGCSDYVQYCWIIGIVVVVEDQGLYCGGVVDFVVQVVLQFVVIGGVQN